MDERERELLEVELDRYLTEYAIPHRQEFAPENPDEEEIGMELQAVQASLEGYAYGILRMRRLYLAKGEEELDPSEEVLEASDLREISDLTSNAMMDYMEHIEDATAD